MVRDKPIVARTTPLRSEAKDWVACRQTEPMVNGRDYPRRQRLVGRCREQCCARIGNCRSRAAGS